MTRQASAAVCRGTWTGTLCAGLTLIEILVATGIVAILMALFIGVGWPRIIASAEKVRCINNMKALHASLNAYVQAVGHWPQVPEAIDVSSSANDAAYEDWWIEELRPYDALPELWQCATIKRMASNKDSDGRPRIHYTPTPFDSQAFTPYRWKTQPWLIEIGNAHGRGAHLCFSDGSIRPLDDLVR